MNPANAHPVMPNISPEEQVIGIEINRILEKDNPDYAPLPMTDFTPQ
jgi:hypothetical protein